VASRSHLRRLRLVQCNLEGLLKIFTLSKKKDLERCCLGLVINGSAFACSPYKRVRSAAWDYELAV
jgi:hypothetical protein